MPNYVLISPQQRVDQRGRSRHRSVSVSVPVTSRGRTPYRESNTLRRGRSRSILRSPSRPRSRSRAHSRPRVRFVDDRGRYEQAPAGYGNPYYDSHHDAGNSVYMVERGRSRQRRSSSRHRSERTHARRRHSIEAIPRREPVYYYPSSPATFVPYNAGWVHSPPAMHHPPMHPLPQPMQMVHTQGVPHLTTRPVYPHPSPAMTLQPVQQVFAPPHHVFPNVPSPPFAVQQTFALTPMHQSQLPGVPMQYIGHNTLGWYLPGHAGPQIQYGSGVFGGP